MKYKLINKITQEEHLCSKVVIDGFDYYIDDSFFTENDLYIDTGNNSLRCGSNNHTIGGYKKKVIATTKPSIDLPKVIDEVEKLAIDIIENQSDFKADFSQSIAYTAFLSGYYESQETHLFAEEDMIEFALWIADSKLHGYSKQLYEAMIIYKVATVKELLEIWKKRRIKTVYYGNDQKATRRS